jgi:hypothetical protein
MEPAEQVGPLLKLAQETLRLAPPHPEALASLPEAERASMLEPFMTAREQAREQALSLAGSGRITKEGLSAALLAALSLLEEHPALGGELALLSGTAALAVGGPPEAVSWAVALWSQGARQGMAFVDDIALDILGYAFEAVDQGEVCARLAARSADASLEAGWGDGAVYSLRWAEQAFQDSGRHREAAECAFREARIHMQRGDADQAGAAYQRGQELRGG